MEIWFGILTRQAMRRQQIRSYIERWNADAKPFTWTVSANEMMVSLVVVYGISGRECAGVCPGRTSTGEYRSLNRRWATA